MSEDDEEFEGFCSREDILKEECFRCDIPQEFCLGLDTYEQCKKYYEECLSIPADTSHLLPPMQKMVLQAVADDYDMGVDDIVSVLTEQHPERDIKESSVQRALTDLKSKGLVWAKDDTHTYYWNLRDDNIDAVGELLGWNEENS